MSQQPSKSLICTAMAIAISGLYSQAHASGFSLYGEMSGANSGNYAAGGAADARDASALFYNPAGLTRIKNTQMVIAGTGVLTSGKFTGTEGVGALPPQSANGIQGGTSNVVPALYLVSPVNDKLIVGLGVYSPFGLATDWGEDSVVKYSATKSQLLTVNFSPAIAAKFNQHLSLGMAVDVQYAMVKLNVVTGNYSINPTNYVVHNTGDSVSLGAHGGILYEQDENTRVGINYQTQVSHVFEGDSIMTVTQGNGNSGRANNLFSDSILLPGQATLSGYHKFNNKFAVMGTVAYTEWKKLKKIVINNMYTSPIGVTAVTIPENFKNTWRVVGGVDYQYNEKVLLRGGVGYDQTPTNNIDRNLRLPDADRFAVAVGSHYQYSKILGIDVGYTHIFIKEAPVNHATAITSTVGNVKAQADLLGAQLTWQMD